VAPLKAQLTATLAECQDALEPGLRTLGVAVSCYPFGEIDLLALDQFNQLTIIDVDTALGDDLILRGISHVEWVARNLANVRRMFDMRVMEVARPPRLILVARRFSPAVHSAMRQLSTPKVTCFRYHAVAATGGPGILIEPLVEEEFVARGHTGD
jgi:hypothetical protein